MRLLPPKKVATRHVIECAKPSIIPDSSSALNALISRAVAGKLRASKVDAGGLYRMRPNAYVAAQDCVQPRAGLDTSRSNRADNALSVS